MKKSIFHLILILILLGCKSHSNIIKKGQTYQNFRGFVPVDPIEYDNLVQITENGEITFKEIKLLTGDEILQFLNNETVLVSVGEFKSDGGITYMPFTLTSKYSSYKVTMDYMKFATLPQLDENDNFIGFNRVGVGLRLISLLTTFDTGINVGDLSAIGLAAKTGKVKGTLLIEVVGIKSKEITTLLPLPSEINQTTIQNAMQALATIKSKLYDKETKLYPQVMAIKVDKSDSSKITNKSLRTGDSTDKVKLHNWDNEIKLQIGTINNNYSKNYGLAQNLETTAFKLLFERKIDESISKFEECEKLYPGFHNVYEILKFLKIEGKNLKNSNSTKWNEVYSTILKSYSWKLSNYIIEKLSEESKKTE